VDVKLGEEIPAAELIRRLQLVTLEGVDWLAAVALGHNDRALGRVIARAEFWARLPAGVSPQRGIELFDGGGPIAVKRRGEGSGVGRMIDVRRALLALDVPAEDDDAHTIQVRRRLDWPEGDQPLRSGEELGVRALVRMQLAVSAAGSAKPSEVIEALWGQEIADRTSLARVGLWAMDRDQVVDPLDADALRRAVEGIGPPSHVSPKGKETEIGAGASVDLGVGFGMSL
jgi:hypothetical protein